MAQRHAVPVVERRRFLVRSLWTNNDEVLFDAARPIILNGIGEIITRPDLADRALFVTLQLNLERYAGQTANYWRRSSQAPAHPWRSPRRARRRLEAFAEHRLSEKPRMADFAVWAAACEQAFWREGTFQAAYSSNLDEVVNTVIEADLVGAAVRQLAHQQKLGGHRVRPVKGAERDCRRGYG